MIIVISSIVIGALAAVFLANHSEQLSPDRGIRQLAVIEHLKQTIILSPLCQIHQSEWITITSYREKNLRKEGRKEAPWGRVKPRTVRRVPGSCLNRTQKSNAIYLVGTLWPRSLKLTELENLLLELLSIDLLRTITIIGFQDFYK